MVEDIQQEQEFEFRDIQSHIRVIRFTEFQDRYDEFLKQGELVTILDFPLDLIETPRSMPTSSQKVNDLREDIVRTLEKGRKGTHANGILIAEPLQAVNIPSPTAPVDGEPSNLGLFPIVNGLHREQALRTLRDHLNDHYDERFANTACITIEFRDWALAWERRCQAQAGHKDIAMARLIRFLDESWDQTDWGSRIPFSEIAPYIDIVSTPQELAETADLFDVNTETLLLAIENAKMAIDGAHLTSAEAVQFIHVGLTIHPAISDKVRLTTSNTTRDDGELPLGLAATLGKCFPVETYPDIQQFLYELYLENEIITMTRAQKLTMAAKQLVPTLIQHALTISKLEDEPRAPEEILHELLCSYIINMHSENTSFSRISGIKGTMERMPKYLDPEDLEEFLKDPKYWREEKSADAKSTAGKGKVPSKRKPLYARQRSEVSDESPSTRQGLSSHERIAKEFLKAGFENIDLAIHNLTIALEAHAELGVMQWSRAKGLYRLDNGSSGTLMDQMRTIFPLTIRMLIAQNLPLTPESARAIYHELSNDIFDLMDRPEHVARYVSENLPNPNVSLPELGGALRRTRESVDRRGMKLDELELMISRLEEFAKQFGRAVMVNTAEYGDPRDYDTKGLFDMIDRNDPDSDEIPEDPPSPFQDLTELRI